jgi:hypothetical protein
MAEARSEKRATYRSGEPLRHPKSCAKGSFSAASEAVPFPSLFSRRTSLGLKLKARG